MNWRVKDFFYNVKGVSDDNNLWDVRDFNGLVDAISDSNKFSFHRWNIDCMIDSFNNIFVADINMSNRCNNIMFDASISYYECMGGIWWKRNR